MAILPTFGFETTAEEVAETFRDEIGGKNVIVTGTSINGIGFETARVFAKYANLVVITGYNEERLRLSEEAIKKEIPTANIRQLILDLSSLAAVRKAAAEVNAYPEPIHILINNAAASISERFVRTVDGLESQFATDHVGPFLFTNLLLPKILSSASPEFKPRLVWVASTHHATNKAGIDWDDLKKPDEGKYNNAVGYAVAKGCNILTAAEFGRRLGGRVRSISLCPGGIYTNIQQKENSIESFKTYGILTKDGKPNPEIRWKTFAQGASTTFVAAFDPRFADKSGAFLLHGVDASESVAPWAADPANADRLWKLTEEIVGEKFQY